MRIGGPCVVAESAYCVLCAAAGGYINRELRYQACLHNQDHILMEIVFPQVRYIHHTTTVKCIHTEFDGSRYAQPSCFSVDPRMGSGNRG